MAKQDQSENSIARHLVKLVAFIDPHKKQLKLCKQKLIDLQAYERAANIREIEDRLDQVEVLVFQLVNEVGGVMLAEVPDVSQQSEEAKPNDRS